MKFIVKHEINGRLRIHVVQKRMTYTEADTLSWFLSNQKNVTDVKVYERTADAVICYVGDKEEVLNLLKQFSYENAILPDRILPLLFYNNTIAVDSSVENNILDGNGNIDFKSIKK